MKIIALVENTSTDNNLSCEHGLSLYIETQNHKILFDMGQTDLFAQNAKKLDIDLSDVDIAVLSHGHYDHGGGLEKFLEINKKAPVYMSKYTFKPYYNGTEKYIGLNKELESNDRIIFTDDVVEIAEGLTLYSCNEKERYYDLGSFGLNKKVDDAFLPDDFLHEQYLCIEENGKKVLISGCSHKGILNIVKWFEPDVLIGGFHFSKLPLDETLMEYAKILDEFDTAYFTCHCTGVEQYQFMKNQMRKLSYLATGDIICIE
ncbi:MAG: MBL fold metallo-hydrolase [Agathobacter sp.]|nr:MBL fold metallo-hydrolase [Agathobacter sp.]